MFCDLIFNLLLNLHDLYDVSICLLRSHEERPLDTFAHTLKVGAATFGPSWTA